MPITLITGTSTGIGLATALHFARKGYRVYATMRNPDRGSGPLLEAAQKEGLQLDVSQLDVDDSASVDRAIGEALERDGHIDVLVNNAGLANISVIERTTDATTRAIFETNVFGALRTIRAVLPSMRERRSGTIVNVSSVGGRVVGFGHGLYSGSKHALEAVSEALALEVRQFGIRVAIIEPGFFATPILGKAISTLPSGDASPYADGERQMRDLYSRLTETAGDPCVVAEAIEHAVATSEPQMRYVVGVDAPAFLDRSAMRDEE